MFNDCFCDPLVSIVLINVSHIPYFNVDSSALKHPDNLCQVSVRPHLHADDVRLLDVGIEGQQQLSVLILELAELAQLSNPHGFSVHESVSVPRV